MILEGQRILITGASGGIGKACALGCAKEGARIVLVARNLENLENVRKNLPGKGHIAIQADLQYPEDCVSDIFKKACCDGMKLTGFVHAAGLGPVIPIKAISSKLLSEIFTINYFSFMLMVKQFIRSEYSNGGSIVAISSIASTVGWQGASAYAGTKGALDSSIRALSVELAHRGYRLNSILPSHINTELFQKTSSVIDQNVINTLMKRQILGLGSPEDVANAVLFLMNPSSKFITGSCLTVDGGYTAN